MNQVEIMGNIGKTPEFIMGSTGEFTSFSVAVNSEYTNGEGVKVQHTEWMPCVCFIPGIVKFIKENVTSGNAVYLKGAISTRSYTQEHVMNTTTNEPHKQSKTEIRVTHLHKVATVKKDEPVDEPA